ncbi:MAG: DNA recombination protein RmuC, partial [Betaproteobacteria bacterium]|nr:DNA recombination protein RmuC [Betaproteobacteria bacterium]
MNGLFVRGYSQLADYLSAPLVREWDSNAPIPLSSEWVLRLTWTHLADLVRILKVLAPLRAVAYGWRQEALAKNAQEAADPGKQLYERIAKPAEHWSEVGNWLNKAVDATTATSL